MEEENPIAKAELQQPFDPLLSEETLNSILQYMTYHDSLMQREETPYGQKLQEIIEFEWGLLNKDAATTIMTRQDIALALMEAASAFGSYLNRQYTCDLPEDFYELKRQTLSLIEMRLKKSLNGTTLKMPTTMVREVISTTNRENPQHKPGLLERWRGGGNP